MDRLRKFPDALFLASPAWKDELRRALENAPPPKNPFH
jgi:hypothetical protein